MGSGRWSEPTYTSRTEATLRSGKDIFHATARATSTGDYSIHELLNPLTVNKAGAHEGQNVRESCDSDEHPNSRAIAVFFDCTGSMKDLPRLMQSKLPKLHGLILTKGYLEHPQIMFGAIGDATCDRVPFQVGQFESDNRMDENLEALILEGGGGGGNHESYELAAWFLANKTSLDCWDKRGEKGYAFFIGDERAYDIVRAHQVTRLMGDGIQEDIPTVDVFNTLNERYDVFYLFAAQGSYRPDDVLPVERASEGALGWRTLVGQNALILEDAGAVCEAIALAIGINEGAIDLSTGLDHLREMDTDAATVDAVGTALAPVAVAVGAGATASGTLPGEGDDTGADRV